MARRNIVERYIRADIEKRVEIILDNYGMFNRILDGYEQSLSIVIRNERDYNRKRLLGDSGIRVQTSNIGDITAQTAVENVTIQQAIHDGDWYAATKGAMDKMDLYRASGIYPGKNLIFTYETDKKPLDIKGMRKMLFELFCHD
ncbi:MAG: hypothetical protein E7309_11635 [Butyrivibrio sp.]|jgi:hypothetical protein|nr:hypothetical protein [Butyrivibrio sp.]